MNWFLAHHYGGYCRHCIVLCCDRRRTSSARRHTFFLFSVCRMAGGLQLQTRAGYGGFSGVQTPSNKKKTKRRQSQLFLNYVSNLNCRRALSTHTQCDCGPDSNVQQCCECDCHFSPAMRSSACEMPTNFVWLLMPANNYRFIERTVCCKSSMLSDDFSRLH